MQHRSESLLKGGRPKHRFSGQGFQHLSPAVGFVSISRGSILSARGSLLLHELLSAGKQENYFSMTHLIKSLTPPKVERRRI